MPTQPRPEEQAVSAADANRHFSRLLREVREGRSYVVTSHGRPVARLVPYAPVADDLRAERQAFFEALRKRPAGRAGAWTRDELYER